ncbi:unnamed protein product [Lymnaea stagnalis]|uniref:BPTI/Kunitz inhibitor domain-containing protein n=2 Tax=Lymnaea stagnalis TaxID=6523 RepID=A0AAV2IAD2_LYMST
MDVKVVLFCLLGLVWLQVSHQKDDICSLPSETGPCKGNFLRYHYNSSTNACDSFVYGGCKGNANNFQDIDDCKAACID